MKPTIQTTFGNGDGSDGMPCGNCFSACIASIFELPLESVPLFVLMGKSTGYGFEFHLNEWLEPYSLQSMYIFKKDGEWSGYLPNGYSIGTGLTSRGLYHSVVCLDGKQVWDPFPEDTPDPPDIEYYLYFACTDPGKLK